MPMQQNSAESHKLDNAHKKPLVLDTSSPQNIKLSILVTSTDGLKIVIFQQINFITFPFLEEGWTDMGMPLS